jgi:glutamate dehydrogenase/leucine dehydrogenase
MSKIASFTETETLSVRHLTDPALPVPEKKKRVVVTGGSGKLGRWVAREMSEHGWDVFVCESRFCYPVYRAE